MENQLESSFQGSIIQFPQHHWRLFLNVKIDTYEGQDIMVMDVPNAFIQTNMPQKKYGEERVIIKITGVIVDMLV